MGPAGAAATSRGASRNPTAPPVPSSVPAGLVVTSGSCTHLGLPPAD